MQKLRNFDIFPKFDSRFEQEARDKTVFGAGNNADAPSP